MFPYQPEEWQAQALSPVRFWAHATLGVFDNPLLSAFRGSLTERLLEDLAFAGMNPLARERSSFNIAASKFRGMPIDVIEERMGEYPFCRIVHFNRCAGNESVTQRLEGDPKLLIIPPLSGHFASILYDTVATLLPSHDISIIDWIDARNVPVTWGRFGLEEQITYVSDLIHSLGPDIHVLAVTQASFIALAAIGLLASEDQQAQPLSLTLLGGPIDASRGYVAFREMAQKYPREWFETNHIQTVPPYYPGAFRRVFPGSAQMRSRMALAMKSSSAEMTKYFQHLVRGDDETTMAHDRLYNEFLSVMDIPAELYLDFIEEAYAKCSLAKGELSCQGQKINLAAITKTALMTVEAELDDLSPPGQTRAALDLCTGLSLEMKEDHLEIGVGHYGIFSGRKWRNNIAPAIHRFIRKHALITSETT